MTDRLSGCTVVFEQDIRIDDAQDSVMQAIQQIRGVATVVPVIREGGDFLMQQRENLDIRRRLGAFVESNFGREKM